MYVVEQLLQSIINTLGVVRKMRIFLIHTPDERGWDGSSRNPNLKIQFSEKKRTTDPRKDFVKSISIAMISEPWNARGSA